MAYICFKIVFDDFSGRQSCDRIQRVTRSRRSVVYRNLIFFIPAACFSSFSALSHYGRGLQYTNFLHCFGCNSEDRPCLWWVSVAHQTFHTVMIWTVLILGGLVLVELAQCVASCLEILVEPGDITTDMEEGTSILENLNWRLESYGKLNKLIHNFNELFKWQIFLQMAVVVIHLCIFVYRPLKYWNEIGTPAATASLANAVFSLFGINFSVHRGLGLVYEKSKRFLPAFNKLLASANRSLFLRGSEPVKYIPTIKMLGSTTPFIDHHHHCYLEEIQLVNNEKRAQIESLKLQTSSCIPFGFESGIFFYS